MTCQIENLEILQGKTCVKCGTEKPRSEFYPRANAQDGLRANCKHCQRDAARQWAKMNPLRHSTNTRAWAKANPEKQRAAVRNWTIAHPDRVRELARAWQKANPETARAWRVANPDKAKATLQRYRSANRGQTRAATAAWAKANPEKQKARSKKWYALNLGKAAAKSQWRHAQKIHATPAWANSFFIEEIYDLAMRRTKALGFKWHVDHIVPLKSKLVCGLHVEHNLQVLPAVTNMSKSNRHWPDMPCEQEAT